MCHVGPQPPYRSCRSGVSKLPPTRYFFLPTVSLPPIVYYGFTPNFVPFFSLLVLPQAVNTFPSPTFGLVLPSLFRCTVQRAGKSCENRAGPVSSAGLVEDGPDRSDSAVGHAAEFLGTGRPATATLP